MRVLAFVIENTRMTALNYEFEFLKLIATNCRLLDKKGYHQCLFYCVKFLGCNVYLFVYTYRKKERDGLFSRRLILGMKWRQVPTLTSEFSLDCCTMV